MEYTVYILKSLKDQNRYVGITGNLKRRIEEHEKGLVKSTRHRRPIKLVYIEKFANKEEALKRERFFKTGQGRAWLSVNTGA